MKSEVKDIKMNREIADKCIDFCEGSRKGKNLMTRTYSIKNEHFPDNLREGTEIQKKINILLEKGFSTRQIAMETGITQPTIMSHIKYYKDGLEFYNEWNLFWEFITPIKNIDIQELFGDLFTKTEYKHLKELGVTQLGSLIMLYARNNMKQFETMKIRVYADRKNKIFNKIKSVINDLFDNQEENLDGRK